MEAKNPIHKVFDYWNSYKGQGYGRGKWKSHRIMSIPCQKAIRARLREGYTVDDLKQAIDNYALVLLSRDYEWTYAWSLLHFLVRRHPHRRNEEQLSRWLPGEFDEDDYIKPDIKVARARPSAQQQIVPVTEAEKAAIWAASPFGKPQEKKPGVNEIRNKQRKKLGL